MAKKVLVVDDNQLIRKLAEVYLGKEGWTVELCEGPFGVLQKARSFKPDIILMDLKMPGLGGEKLASMLKAASATCCAKIVTFSSEAEAVHKQMVENGIADGYFVKSHTFNGLTEAMERVLEGEEVQSRT